MKNNTRKILLAMLVVMTLIIGMVGVTASAADENTVYLDATKWNTTGARIVIYTWDGGEQWFDMTDSDGDGIFECALPDGISNIIFVLFPADSGNDWEQKIAQTNDLTLSVGDTYIIESAGQGDVKATGKWKSGASNSTGGGAATEGTTYTVAGVAALCGSEWSTTDTYNDMTFNAETGLYEKTFTGVPAGFYECKVAADHAWDQSWGGGSGEYGNYGFELTEEMNVTITFNASTKTVGHVTSASTGATERPTPEAPDIDWEDTITVYVGDSAYWNNVYVYCWTQGSSDQNAAWPGVEMEWDGERMLYYYEIPTYYVNIIFSDGNGTQTADMTVPGDGALYDNVTNTWIDIEDYIPPVPAENTTEEVTVHVKDDAGWGEVYVYYWGADGEEPGFAFPGIPMERDENGYFTAVIPAGYWGVVFSNGGDWQDGSLLQTPDLVIPTNGKTYIKNTAKDSTEWYSVGGNQPSGDSTTPDAPADDEPVKEMTFLQKLALKLLLFLRSIEDMFKGIFKK